MGRSPIGAKRCRRRRHSLEGSRGRAAGEFLAFSNTVNRKNVNKKRIEIVVSRAWQGDFNSFEHSEWSRGAEKSKSRSSILCKKYLAKILVFKKDVI